MDWEEKFEEFSTQTPEETKYGPIIGPYLHELKEKDVHGKQSWLVEQRYRGIQDLFGYAPEEVPEEIQQKFLENPNLTYSDILEESLQSHDESQLHRAIEKYFGPQDKWEVEGGGKKAYIRWYPSSPTAFHTFAERFQDFLKTGKRFRLQDIAQLYGYNISRVNYGSVVFEAEWPEDATEYVSETCGGYAYHVVHRAMVNDILKTGLRVKNGPSWEVNVDSDDQVTRVARIPRYKMYRYFPRRVYLYATPTQDRKKLLDELEGVANKVSEGGWSEAAVLRAYVKGQKMYWDPAMDDDGHSVFTYTSVPPQRLERIY